MKHFTVDVYAGAGGENAKDFSRMLINMYSAFGSRWGTLVISSYDGENGSVEFDCPTDLSFDFKNETGVHRLIRRSPFDPEHRRQTAFAGVRVNCEETKHQELQQIRTYTFDPYQLAKNEYNDIECDDLVRVFAGQIELMY